MQKICTAAENPKTQKSGSRRGCRFLTIIRAAISGGKREQRRLLGLQCLPVQLPLAVAGFFGDLPGSVAERGSIGSQPTNKPNSLLHSYLVR